MMLENSYMFAVSDHDGLVSLADQLCAMGGAVLVGRFALHSRVTIWAAAFVGTIGAMLVHMMFDGQAAFLLLLYTPVVYFLAVLGRDRELASYAGERRNRRRR